VARYRLEFDNDVVVSVEGPDEISVRAAFNVVYDALVDEDQEVEVNRSWPAEEVAEWLGIDW